MSQIQAAAGDADDIGSELDRFIGERVHTLMFRNRVSQVRLGQALGTSQTGIARRLRGQIGWRSVDLVLAARALGTTVGYLVGETDDGGWAPWGSNPRPADYLGVVSDDNRITFADDERDAIVTSIDEALRFRTAVLA